LRERPEDILLLARHFVAKYTEGKIKALKDFSKTGIEKLIGYDWPGNVLELENIIQRAIFLSNSPSSRQRMFACHGKVNRLQFL
jgi:DNA-binding NtrC family response regulator